MSHGFVICETTGKRGWQSRHIAISTCRAVGNRVRAYRCESCNRWHVTHESIKAWR